jgi:EmrB/QacA subfamily drug resistance transporter
LQWTVNAYGIAFAAGIITAAAIGDRLGRRRVFCAGVGLFTVTSIVCALAPGASWLIAGRAMQGLGGAIVLPLSLTILTDAYPAERRGTVLGVYGGLAGPAVALGPLVGGAITQGLDWHWIFWANVPLGAITLICSPRLLPESHGPAARVDADGVVLVTAGVVGVVWGLVRAGAAGWGSAEVIGTLLAGCMLLAGFVAWEAHTPSPMIPLSVFRSRGFSAGNVIGFCMSGAIFAAGFLVTDYFQLGQGDSPITSGVRLLPLTITPVLVSAAAGARSDRIGRRPLIVVGMLLNAGGLAWSALETTQHPGYLPLMIALFIAGAGISMALPTVPAEVLSTVAPDRLGTASGVTNTTQRFGAVFGIAIASTTFSAFGHLATPHGVIDGIQPALGACAALALLGTLAALALPGRPPDPPPHP